jgi:hypothetical protein
MFMCECVCVCARARVYYIYVHIYTHILYICLYIYRTSYNFYVYPEPHEGPLSLTQWLAGGCEIKACLVQIGNEEADIEGIEEGEEVADPCYNTEYTDGQGSSIS